MTADTSKTATANLGLSAAARQELVEVTTRYPIKRSAILHGLRLVEQEAGYLTEQGMRDVAELLELRPHAVYDVATFYTMYHLRPKGDYLLQVCRTLPCALSGAESLVAHLEKRLGIRDGETTADGKFTLVTVECLAACGGAPAMQVNDDYYESLTLERVDELIEQWKHTPLPCGTNGQTAESGASGG